MHSDHDNETDSMEVEAPDSSEAPQDESPEADGADLNTETPEAVTSEDSMSSVEESQASDELTEEEELSLADQGGVEEDEIETLRLELEAAQVAKADLKDRLLRAAADVENVKRRSKRDLADAQRFGVEKLLKDRFVIIYLY